MSNTKYVCLHSNKESIIRAFESFLVLLNISTYCSVIPYIVFHQYSRGWTISLISLLNISYLFFRFGLKVKIPSDKLFFLFLCINILNILTILFSGKYSILPFLYTILNASFYLLLYNIYKRYNYIESVWRSIWLVVRGYVWLGAIGVISAISLLVFIKMGLNPWNTPVVDNYYDLFKSNVELTGHTYYYPYYISVLEVSKSLSVKMPFFTEYGTICGVFHEPHVITFVVFPVLFILWAYTKSTCLKFFYFVVWVLLLLMEFSTTNILAFSFSLLLYISVEKNKRIWLIPIGLLLLLLFLYIGLENTELFIVADKIDGDNTSSRDYTLGTIEFAFTPNSLLGSDFTSNDYLYVYSTEGGRDVGYLQFITNILFLMVFIYRMIKTILFSYQFRLIGIAVLYFFLHSMKTAMVTYTSPQLLMMMFLLFVMTNDKCYAKNRASLQNS